MFFPGPETNLLNRVYEKCNVLATGISTWHSPDRRFYSHFFFRKYIIITPMHTAIMLRTAK